MRRSVARNWYGISMSFGREGSYRDRRFAGIRQPGDYQVDIAVEVELAGKIKVPIDRRVQTLESACRSSGCHSETRSDSRRNRGAQSGRGVADGLHRRGQGCRKGSWHCSLGCFIVRVEQALQTDLRTDERTKVELTGLGRPENCRFLRCPQIAGFQLSTEVCDRAGLAAAPDPRPRRRIRMKCSCDRLRGTSRSQMPAGVGS